ncbi:MAG TPA: flavin reductase family protein [Jatrophihabitantaceae bacterium]|jgi:flavin reductase (DIM6/NTAB) family NADH-FMN oxidoreductase RutF|nr:flavin reductase family protein [Jatrophihabitantaceae bacterium]
MTDQPDRLEIRPSEVPPRGIYPWFTSSLIPRAIAWVSTMSADGIANVAPHSFTTVAGVDPPTLCFVSVGAKDTLANVRATGEFVLNIGTESMLAAMNDTATNFPPEVDEFAAAGLSTAPSVTVAPPRVAGSPVAFECRFSDEKTIGDCVMIFGEVQLVTAARSVLAGDGLPDARRLAPLARLGRAEWTTLGEVIPLNRIRWGDWEKGARSQPDDVAP